MGLFKSDIATENLKALRKDLFWVTVRNECIGLLGVAVIIGALTAFGFYYDKPDISKLYPIF